MTDGKLYEVEILEEDIFHIGDMALIDVAFRSRENHEFIEECAIKYWNGGENENNVIEVLVNHASVCVIISKDQDERSKYLKSWALA